MKNNAYKVKKIGRCGWVPFGKGNISNQTRLYQGVSFL